MMVSVLLPRAEFDTDDSADALAIAICHAHHRGAAALRVAAQRLDVRCLECSMSYFGGKNRCDHAR